MRCPGGVSVGSDKPAAGAAIPAPAEPSWGRVLVTTVKLSVAWRLRAAGSAPAKTGGLVAAPGRLGLGLGACHAGHPVVHRSRLPSRASSNPSSRRGSGPVPGRGLGGRPGERRRGDRVLSRYVRGAAGTGRHRGTAAAAAARDGRPDRRQRDGDLAVDPHRGVRARAYRELRFARYPDRGPRGRARRGVRDRSALRADLAARKAAGSELVRNRRLAFTAADAAQLRAGEVDSRLLTTLAALASQYSLRVTAFGDASPGAAVLFRQVTITGADLAGAQALVRTQSPPYLPAHVAIMRSAACQTARPSSLPRRARWGCYRRFLLMRGK